MATKKRKRRESFGQIEKLPSGRYRARYFGDDGQRHTAPMTFDTVTDARAYLAGVQTDMSRGDWVSPVTCAAAKKAAATTLAEHAESWLTTNRSRKGEPLRPRTVAEYRRLLAGSLADLAPLPLSSITADVVDQWFDAQSRTGKLTQASRAYSLLSTILGHAVDRGHITANPCRVRGAQSARTGKKVIPPTDAQLAMIVAVIPERFKALIYLAAEAGLRWGEATELRRSDVVVERDADGAVKRVLVTVERAVARTAEGFVVGPTKTAAGVRSVYVYGDAAQVIADHLTKRVGRFGDPLLFPALGDETGQRHLSQSTFHTPTWNDARTAAGRPDMPFHALRHYAGTRYAQHGATLAETMSRLGHASMTVAMRYQHATDRDAEIAARMAARGASA